VACEKPLGRTLTEAREMLRLAEDAKLLHGYLENQVFSSAVQRGKDGGCGARLRTTLSRARRRGT
jgi:predicted dehydrogenase